MVTRKRSLKDFNLRKAAIRERQKTLALTKRLVVARQARLKKIQKSKRTAKITNTETVPHNKVYKKHCHGSNQEQSGYLSPFCIYNKQYYKQY